MSTIAARQLAITVGLAIAGLLGLAMLFLATSAVETGTRDRLTRALALQDAVGRLRVSLAAEESGIRGYLLTSDHALADDYTDARTRTLGLLSKVDSLVSNTAETSALMAAVRQGIDTWQLTYAEPAIAAMTNGSGGAYRTTGSLKEGSTLFGNAVVAINHLGTTASREQAAAAAADDGLSADRIWIFAGTAAALLILSILATVGLQRSVARPIAALATIAEQVQDGRDVMFPEHRRDEIGRLARSLEGMRVGLITARTVAESARQEEGARSAERKTLNDFTELLQYLDEEDAVVGATADALMDSLAPDTLVVHLANASLDRASLALVRGESAASPMSMHLLDRCPGVRRGSAFLIPDVELPMAIPCPAHGATAGTVACLPMTSGRELVGTIHLVWSTPRRPSEATWRLADRIAGQAALAISNRRLLVRLEVAANTDPRTRLPNSRAFDLQAERALAARGDEPTALMMLDLDHFKNLNDQYGHPAGDEALRLFAEILRGSLRGGDLPARYGGEEFAVLLPGASLDVAIAVAERIRAAVEASPLQLAPGITAKITVSVGVAVAPMHGTERLHLLAAADRALYLAKQAGRNMVVSGTVLGAIEAPVVPG